MYPWRELWPCCGERPTVNDLQSLCESKAIRPRGGASGMREARMDSRRTSLSGCEAVIRDTGVSKGRLLSSSVVVGGTIYQWVREEKITSTKVPQREDA